MAGVGASAGPGSMVALDAVGKRFRRHGPWVLDQIDLDVAAGTMVVVQGGNGSGKTTLLRTAAGIARPTVGRVRRAAESVGFVPERLPARSHMTAAQYTRHMGRIRGLDDRSARERSAVLFERLALTPSPDVRVGLLSKGNAQKVALAQALLGRTELLVLDEPYTGLDVSAHDELTRLLAEARADGTAVIVTAHEVHEIPGADLVICLRNGTLGAATRPEPAREGHSTVELRAGIRPVSDFDLLARDGLTLIEGAATERAMVLLVADGSLDDLLTAAIAAGWSVHRVSPGPSRAPDDR
jgi:ABC-type multidrug transport system ATPase subunit